MQSRAFLSGIGLVGVLLLVACGSQQPEPIRATLTAQSSDADLAAMQAQLTEAGVTMGLNEIQRDETGAIRRIVLTFACDPTQPIEVRSDSLAPGDTIYFVRHPADAISRPCEAGIRG